MGAYAPPIHVSAPPVTSRPFGLFSAAPPTTDASPHWRNGQQWEPEPCGEIDGIGPSCGTIVDRLEHSEGLPKDFKRQDDLSVTTPFVVLGSYLCSPAGRPIEEAFARARADLELHEQRAVERFVWSGELGNEPSLVSADTTSLTANPTDAPTAVGLLEQWLSERYGGTGTLHVPRLAIATLKSAGLIHQDGDTLRTVLDTPVAAYAGSPNTSPANADAAAGTAWVYITPAVQITRSEVFSDDLELQILDRATNDLFALAERYYSVGWDDCGVAAANLDLGCCNAGS